MSRQISISATDRNQPVVECFRCGKEANWLGVEFRHTQTDKEVEFVEAHCDNCGHHDTHVGNCCHLGREQRKQR